MTKNEGWQWTFSSYWGTREGKAVQIWFDNLPIEAKEEVGDLCQKLAAATSSLWRRPEFDPLDGESGISEIRPNNIPTSVGNKTYRIYGFFGPHSREYTFLHGTEKKTRNDKNGKRIARERLSLIRNKQATTHKFDFTPSDSAEIKAQPRIQGKILRFESQ
jgi:hypothetical protein